MTGLLVMVCVDQYTMYSTKLRDAFDFRDVGASRDDGPNGTTGIRPYCNSHYTRHLLGLHSLPLALSGQRYDATTGSLSFSPRKDLDDQTRERPSDELQQSIQWSFFTPQGSGIIRKLEGACVRIKLLTGSLMLSTLQIDDMNYNLHALTSSAHNESILLSPSADIIACATPLQKVPSPRAD